VPYSPSYHEVLQWRPVIDLVTVICWWQITTTGGTLGEMGISRRCAPVSGRIFPGDDPVLNTTHTENDSEMMKEVQERKLH